jgi:uncharacterized membrane protein YphA (DoxX/SURF4 family)
VKQRIGLLARLITGSVWIVAGAIKLPDPAESVRAVRAYDLLPEAVVPTVGHLLPIVEVVIGVCLVLGLLTRSMGVISGMLFGLFMFGIASAWARGLEINCGCFGGGGLEEGASSKYPAEIARDLGLLLLSVWLVVWPRTRWSLDAVVFPPRAGEVSPGPGDGEDGDVEAQRQQDR